MSELTDLIKQLVQEVLDEQAAVNKQVPNMQGAITAVNSDGTVDVQASDGTVYSACGTPKVRNLGEIVILVTADGKRIAV
jgi:hypothetical protein